MALGESSRKRGSRDSPHGSHCFLATGWVLSTAVMLTFAPGIAAQPATCAPPGSELPPDVSQWSEPMRELASCISAKFLYPILGRLRALSANDATRTDLLQGIFMDPVAAPRPHTGPNAAAEYRGRYRVITVDPYFLMEMFTLADLAGLVLAEPDADVIDPVVFLFAQTLRRDARVAAGAARAPPPARFEIDDHVAHPATRALARALGYEALSAGLAWVVLHEVAHHELGHTRPSTRPGEGAAEPSLAMMRQWERDADEAAFDDLEKSGYGLAPLHAFMQAQDLAERIRSQHGTARPAGAATHPSFASRVRRLERRDLRRPPGAGNYALILEPSTDSSGAPAVSTILVPLREESGLPPLAFHESAAGFLPFERIGDEGRLYGRANGIRSEIIVDDLTSLRPVLTTRVTSEATGRTQVSRTIGFRAAWAADIMEERVGPVAVADLLNLDLASRLVAIVRGIDARPAVGQEVASAYRATVQSFASASIEYAKGRLDAAQYVARVSGSRQDLVVRLTAILGAEGYARLSAAWLADPLIGWTLARPDDPAIR